MEDRDIYMIKATIFEASCGRCKVKVFETISTTLMVLVIILKNISLKNFHRPEFIDCGTVFKPNSTTLLVLVMILKIYLRKTVMNINSLLMEQITHMHM